jgi:monoamine oxidase
LGVPLEPFVQVNHNAYLHASQAFGGHPQRYRHVQADFYGCIAELLAKAVPQSSLSQAVTREERDKLLEALRFWGALDKNYAYREGAVSSARRGYGRKPGGGLRGVPQPSKPIAPRDLLKSDLWRHLAVELFYNFQTTLFQPAGGMDRIADAFTREVGDVFTYGAKAISIGQDENGVAVTYRDAKARGLEKKVHADWCVCTLPLSILRAIDLSVGRDLHDAIRAVPYASATKVGLQFKRRFWEEDEEIYGGITFTDLPIAQIGYPNGDYLSTGKGVLLGAYSFAEENPEFGALSPDEQVRKAVEYGARIHPQYVSEYENGIAVAWQRDPWALGCYSLWSDEIRRRHYRALCEIDGRIVLAGEHASYVNAWQEGAVLSSLDAIKRLHQRVIGS